MSPSQVPVGAKTIQKKHQPGKLLYIMVELKDNGCPYFNLSLCNKLPEQQGLVVCYIKETCYFRNPIRLQLPLDQYGVEMRFQVDTRKFLHIIISASTNNICLLILLNFASC